MDLSTSVCLLLAPVRMKTWYVSAKCGNPYSETSLIRTEIAATFKFPGIVIRKEMPTVKEYEVFLMVPWSSY